MATTNDTSSIPDGAAASSNTGTTDADPTTTAAAMTTTTDNNSITTATTTTTAPKKSKTPSDFLKSILGRPIRVKLNSGMEYRGVLGSLDGYLNIAMEQTEEYSPTGQLRAKYGDCFIRGNNGTLL